MTDLDSLPDLFTAPPDATALERKPRRCLHPRDQRRGWMNGLGERGWTCNRCGKSVTAETARRGKNNRKRGNAAELVTARAIGGRKMGPLGLPWDVEMPGYARLQVRKYARPESVRKIAAELARIGSGAEMPGYIWIEPGRGGERLIVFRLADFAERHGIPEPDPERDNAAFGVARKAQP